MRQRYLRVLANRDDPHGIQPPLGCVEMIPTASTHRNIGIHQPEVGRRGARVAISGLRIIAIVVVVFQEYHFQTIRHGVILEQRQGQGICSAVHMEVVTIQANLAVCRHRLLLPQMVLPSPLMLEKVRIHGAE